MTVSTWIVTNEELPDNPLPVPVPVDISTALAVAVDRAAAATSAAAEAEAAAASIGAPAWEAITGKPAAFPPTAHGHVMADVSGLAAAFLEKANVSDAVLAGDTISGGSF